ncbi:MAG: hypothetical protein WBO06_01505 [Gammaproteobacteria bacterium]
MNSSRAVMFFMTLALLASAPLSADVLLLDSIQSAPAVETPRRGISMSKVRQQYGEPMAQHGAVGDPPISRWDYNGFSVFFEHDLVLHSVKTRQVNQ